MTNDRERSDPKPAAMKAKAMRCTPIQGDVALWAISSVSVGLFTLTVLLAGCDQGLAPPEEPPMGAIQGYVTYSDRPTWPPRDSLRDLRFVALPFVPRDTVDLLQLNRLVFSERLAYRVARDTFHIDDVPAQAYVYNAVAQQFTRDILDWRPVGLYEENGGLLVVRPDETTFVEISVDFRNLPPFPPE